VNKNEILRRAGKNQFHHRGHRETQTVNKNEISGAVVDAAMKIHSALDPGQLESAYAACLKHELIKRGLNVACEVPLPVIYPCVSLCPLW